MPVRIAIERQGELSELELPEGVVELGGASEGALPVPGASTRIARLFVQGGELRIVGDRDLEVAGQPFPALVGRALLPGEAVRLPDGAQLRHRPTPPPRRPASGETAAVALEFLGELAALPGGAYPALTCLTGRDAGRSFPLPDAETLLGRSPAAQVRIRDRSVSREHALLRRTGGRWEIEDLGTPNGIYVNGRRAAGPTMLSDGALLELGFTQLKLSAPSVAEPPAQSMADASDSPPANEALEEPVEAARLPALSERAIEWALLWLGGGLAAAGLWLALS